MMEGMKPKDRHEHLLALADRAKIVRHLEAGGTDEVTKIAVTLARQCDLLIRFRRLWTMRISDLDEALGSDSYTRNIFENKGALYKELFKSVPR